MIITLPRPEGHIPTSFMPVDQNSLALTVIAEHTDRFLTPTFRLLELLSLRAVMILS